MIPLDPDKVHFNEKLDHLQARRPFTYNLVTGVLIGLVLLAFGVLWTVVVTYALSWAAVRWFLWRPGRILRRQYEVRQVRAAEEKAYEKLLPEFLSDAVPVNPYRVAYELNEFLTEDTIYVGDGGDVVTVSAQAVLPRGPGRWMDPGPLGTLGVGVPFAMAAKYVHPEREVLAYFGDGAFSMTGWDFETCVRFNLPFLGVVGNNSAMNQIRCGQIGKYGPERGCVGNKLGDVDFEKFAECFGGWGIAVREPSQIRPALEKARERVAGGQCAIVNIWVDINEYAPGTKAQTMYK